MIRIVRRWLAPTLALFLVVPRAAAQESGDTLAPPPPGAADLEVYSLAVDPTEYPDQDAVLLLDEGHVRIERDGTSRATFRTVRQLLSEPAARAAAELSLGFHGGRQRLTVDWARVVDEGGDMVSGPVHLRETDPPVGRGSPIYTDWKVLRGSLGAVEAGRIVDLQTTRTVIDPVIPGDFFQRWQINTRQPVLRSRFVLDTPADMEPRILERNLPGPAQVTRTGDRVVREWRYRDIAAIEPELMAADSNDVEMSVLMAGPLSWDDIADWYDSLATDPYQVTPEVEAAFAAEVEGAASRADSLRALHRWIAQDVRYVSLSLGMGGYQPRTPAEVVRTGVGDCKDKTTLFIALARRMGVEAYPALVRTAGEVELELPSPKQFNHMVVAVRQDGGWHFVDLTVPVAPYDEVFGVLQGRDAVILHPGGRAETVSIPLSEPEDNRSVITVVGELDADGTLRAEYTEMVTGGLQYRIRGEFARPLDNRREEAVRRNLGARVARGGQVDSMEVFDGLDLDAPARLWASVRADNTLQRVGDAWLLPLRLPPTASPEMIALVEQEHDRRFPYDAGKFFGIKEHHTEYRIVLPEGWSAELPDDIRATSDFGHYEGVYAQEGRELMIRRVMRGASGVLPPDAQADLLAWLRTLAEDHVEHIVLRPDPSSAADPAADP